MNLCLLPKELQDLIGEFNVEHRQLMRLTTNELLEKHKRRIITDSFCRNCGDDNRNTNYTRYIYWCKYVFCDLFCQYSGERSIRSYYQDV
jgi:hypothetical protein